jgi:hypothetical protein
MVGGVGSVKRAASESPKGGSGLSTIFTSVRALAPSRLLISTGSVALEWRFADSRSVGERTGRQLASAAPGTTVEIESSRF